MRWLKVERCWTFHKVSIFQSWSESFPSHEWSSFFTPWETAFVWRLAQTAVSTTNMFSLPPSYLLGIPSHPIWKDWKVSTWSNPQLSEKLQSWIHELSTSWLKSAFSIANRLFFVVYPSMERWTMVDTPEKPLVVTPHTDVTKCCDRGREGQWKTIKDSAEMIFVGN